MGLTFRVTDETQFIFRFTNAQNSMGLAWIIHQNFDQISIPHPDCVLSRMYKDTLLSTRNR